MRSVSLRLCVVRYVLAGRGKAVESGCGIGSVSQGVAL